MSKKIFLISTSILIGAVFIFSGYTKLVSIESFEFTFVDIGISSWSLAPFMARFFIGLEFFVGVLFLLNIRPALSSKIALVTLLVFSVYLLALIFVSGNKGNCGCFGTVIEMTPAQALAKNIFMMLFIFMLLKLHQGFDFQKITKPIIVLACVFSFAMPFVLSFVNLDYSRAYLSAPQKNFQLELDSLNKYAQLNKVPTDLASGKRVVAFLSLTCSHCKLAANKLRIMNEKNPQIQLFFILYGNNGDLKSFFDETGSGNFPWCTLPGKTFIFLARGTTMPVIFLLNNGIVENRLNHESLDQGEIEKWLSQN